MKPYGFFFCGGGGEIIIYIVVGKRRKSDSPASTVTILFLLRSLSTLSQVILGVILEMLFVSLCDVLLFWEFGTALKSDTNGVLHGEKQTQIIS